MGIKASVRNDNLQEVEEEGPLVDLEEFALLDQVGLKVLSYPACSVDYVQYQQ
ncbi:17272_t:CDS:2, partial [Acaulospora colombiana]